MWAVAFVVQFLLDYRIAKAITGNTGAAVLTSLVVSGLLSAITLAAAQLWEKRSSLERRQVVLGLLVAAALMCAVISVIVTLAPKRATQDYAKPIETAEQQLVMFNEDGDTTAADLTRAEIEGLAAEMIDRFGELPSATQNLVRLIEIKHQAIEANIAKIDVGARGTLVTFHKDNFPDPAGLIAYVDKREGAVKLRPDMKLVVNRAWGDPQSRLNGLFQLTKGLSAIVKRGAKEKAPA